jgi:hypothetical protein
MINGAKIKNAWIVGLIGFFLFNLMYFIGGYFLFPGLHDYIAKKFYYVGIGFPIFLFFFPFLLSFSIYLVIVRNKTVKGVSDANAPKWTIWFAVIGFVLLIIFAVVLNYMK